MNSRELMGLAREQLAESKSVARQWQDVAIVCHALFFNEVYVSAVNSMVTISHWFMKTV